MFDSAAGVLLIWEQCTQSVITSGDTRAIRLWDAERELRAFDLPTGADCSVTCLDSTFASTANEKYASIQADLDVYDDGLLLGMDGDSIAGFGNQRQGLIAAGCADGSVRLFDRRCHPSEARVKTWMEHGSWVLGVQLCGDKVVSGWFVYLFYFVYKLVSQL